jgi:hypothetical protein
LRLQYAAERARALVRVLEVVETHSQDARDTVFNVTDARSDYRDEYTGEPGNPYGEPRRELTKLPRSTFAEVDALMAAYGSPSIWRAYHAWRGALSQVEEALRLAEFNYMEGQQGARAEQFADVLELEERCRRALEQRVQAALLRRAHSRIEESDK